MSYRNYDLNSYKRQKNSHVDFASQAESKNANDNSKSNGNFPRMTRAQSKDNYKVSKVDSDVILANPMNTDSHYNGSVRDNQSLNNEQAIRVQFTSSLLDAFVTKKEEFEQFKQNDEK